MVCPGSKWRNKQLRPDVWVAFLHRAVDHLGASLLIVGEERSAFPELFAAFPRAAFLEKPSFPLWQNAMSAVDLVLAVDSSALHLCGTTKTSSFSFFGPTRPELFKPIGAQHGHIHGSCPYGRTFEKQCPILRSCPTGACLRGLEAEELFDRFLLFFQSRN
jgi:heptosyltransferase-1